MKERCCEKMVSRKQYMGTTIKNLACGGGYSEVMREEAENIEAILWDVLKEAGNGQLKAINFLEKTFSFFLYFGVR